MEREEIVGAVRRMQDYIDAHIAEPITLSQLAGAAGYSQYHCEKIFKDLIGKTPFDYIRSLRLSQAALVLRDNRTRIIDVAFDFVFNSHEGFTKAFSRQFGLSPREYALRKPPIRLFIPFRASDHHHIKQKEEKHVSEDKKLQAVFVQVIERPRRKVLLKRGFNAADYYEYCEEVGCDVWGMLSSVSEALYEPIGMWLPKGMRREGTSEYVQGVELPTDYAKPAPDGFEVAEFPPCRMMVFQGPPYDDEQFEDAITDLWEFMKSFDPTLYGFEWADEEAPRFQLVPMGYRGYIEARPVRAVAQA